MHQGVSDLYARLRKEQLGLPPMSANSASYAHYYSHHATPFTYCYSAAVAPKPKDWGRHIDVVRFARLTSAGCRGDHLDLRQQPVGVRRPASRQNCRPGARSGSLL